MIWTNTPGEYYRSAMETAILARLLMRRAHMARRNRWTRGRLEAFQARRLADLRAWAIARSPFYAELHRGLERAPVTELPIVTKKMVMDNFDRLVTDRQVRLSNIESYTKTWFWSKTSMPPAAQFPPASAATGCLSRSCSAGPNCSSATNFPTRSACRARHALTGFPLH